MQCTKPFTVMFPTYGMYEFAFDIIYMKSIRVAFVSYFVTLDILHKYIYMSVCTNRNHLYASVVCNESLECNSTLV